MKLRYALVFGAIATLVGVASAQFSSVQVLERVWNDNPNSGLTVTNNYPSLLQFAETGLNSGTNRHLFYYSDDGGASAHKFGINQYWSIQMDVTVAPTSSSPRQEAGIYFNYNGWDGQMMVASDGEIAVFGYILPFKTWGNVYTAGSTVHVGMEYFKDTDNLNKLAYIMGSDREVFTLTNNEHGILNGTMIGGYVQNQGSATAPRGVTTTFANIVAVPEPATILALGAGLAAFAARRRRK